MKNIITVFSIMLSLAAFADKAATQTYVNNATNKVYQMSKDYVRKYTDLRYAMFILPMNVESHYASSTAYTQFELKASTNNFNAVTDADKFCFYGMSSHASSGEIGYMDKFMLYITDTSQEENRRYLRLQDTLTTLYAPTEYIVLVDVDMLMRSADKSWFIMTNDNLTWQYLKANATT